MMMKISHIIRGEDHISNTPKQILIYEALGAEVPKFGHLGMILAPDRSKLSKRHGATAVSDFVKQGYLTDALINFVALLGWSPSDGVEIKTVEEIAKDFRIHDVSSSNSIFEYDKLNWMNGQYIKKMDISKLTEMTVPFLAKYDLNNMSRENLEKMIEITREPITTLNQLEYDCAYFFGQDVDYTEGLETLKKEEASLVLNRLLELMNGWDFNSDEHIHDKLADFRAEFKEKHNMKPKETMWIVRAAITGRTRGADMAKTMTILGKDVCTHRVKQALEV